MEKLGRRTFSETCADNGSTRHCGQPNVLQNSQSMSLTISPIQLLGRDKAIIHSHADCEEDEGDIEPSTHKEIQSKCSHKMKWRAIYMEWRRDDINAVAIQISRSLDAISLHSIKEVA